MTVVATLPLQSIHTSGGKQYLGLECVIEIRWLLCVDHDCTRLRNWHLLRSGDTVDSSYGEQSDGYGQINHPFRKDIFDLSGNLKQRTYLRWTLRLHGTSTFVGLGRQVVEDFASDGSHRDKATDYFYSTTTDDLLQTVEYGEVTANPNGTFNDIGSDCTRYQLYLCSINFHEFKCSC